MPSDESIAPVTERFEQVYKIAENNLPQLQAKITKLNNVVAKLQAMYPNEQIEPIQFNIIKEEFVPTTTGEHDFDHFIKKDTINAVHHKVYSVHISGSRPSLNGWQFVAKILHGQDDSGQPLNTLLTAPGQEELHPKFRTSDPDCEHCGLSRNRKDTYVLHHPEKGYTQVGSSCLKDFLGHTNPHLLASYLDSLHNFNEEITHDAIDPQGGRGERHYSGDVFDALAAFIVDRFGYLSAAQARNNDDNMSTKHAIINILSGQTKKTMNSDKFQYTPEYKQTPDVKIWQAWDALSPEEQNHYLELGREHNRNAKQLKDQENVSDFEWNMSGSAHDAYVHAGKAGFRAYIPAYFKRQQDNKQKQEEEAKNVQNALSGKFAPQAYNEKDKFNAWVSLKKKVALQTQYGLTVMHIFQDANGTPMVWYASNGASIGDEGEVFPIAGTVKGYKEYNGVNQVVITRVKRLEDLQDNSKQAQAMVDMANTLDKLGYYYEADLYDNTLKSIV